MVVAAAAVDAGVAPATVVVAASAVASHAAFNLPDCSNL